jgi:hypothetical protein
MNILEIEFPFKMEAKLSKYNNKANIIYSIAEPNYTTCINKKEILTEQIKSCENLLRYTNNKNDIGAIEKEIYELKLALDVLI